MLGVNFASLLGLLDIVLAIAYVAVSLTLRERRDEDATGLYLVQVGVIFVILQLCGIILFTQGWRLDPILQFAYLLLNLLVVYLTVKDWTSHRR